MRGPKPKPEALRTGHGKKRHTVQAEPGAPSCPRHLQGEARREWRRVCRELTQLEILSRVDRAALAAYCQLYERWSEAEAKVRELGMVTETAQGNTIQNPWLGIANTALKLMRQYLTEFGLTPSSRCRIEVAPEKPEDTYEAFRRLNVN
jgi:P27 family predicted phage terminase small subunit